MGPSSNHRVLSRWKLQGSMWLWHWRERYGLARQMRDDVVKGLGLGHHSTSNVSKAHGMKAMQRVRAINEKAMRSVFMIAHNLALARNKTPVHMQ